MDFETHPRFNENYEELLNRSFFPVNGPVQIVHMTTAREEEGSAREELSHILSLCKHFEMPAELNAPFVHLVFPTFELRWERHTEFSTYSFITYDTDAAPFSRNVLDEIPHGWLKSVPGKMVSAMHLGVVDGSGDHDIETVRELLQGGKLKASSIHAGKGELWSSFCLDDLGFNRMLIINQSLSECELGRVLRALLELEAYRNMLMLALPLAQEAMANVNDMENELALLLQGFSHEQKEQDDEKFLNQISTMAASIAKYIANSRYRFDASSAYYRMMETRYTELGEGQIDQLQMVSSFVDRRLSPAMRTIEAAKMRLDDLSIRVDRTTDFIRTRIDLSLEKQNQILLQSMDKNAKLQYRLQKTVENLSVVVIAFYFLALMSLAFQGVEFYIPTVPSEVIVAASIPFVLIAVWYFNRKIKQSAKDDVGSH